MSLLKKSADTSNKAVEGTERDSLGGGGVFDTAVYPATIDTMYMTEAASGAVGVVINLIINGRKYSETKYITNKDGKNTFTDKKTNKEQYLPSLVQLDAFSKMMIGRPLQDADTQELTLNVYDWESRREVPTKCEVLTEFTNKPIFVAIQKVRKNKNTKVDNKYVPTNEEQFSNEIEKFFNEDGLTATESAAKTPITEKFLDQWTVKYAGKLKDQYKTVANAPVAGVPGRPATPPSAATAAAVTDDLFGSETDEL